MANLVTLLRLVLLFVLVVMAYQTRYLWLQLANMPLLVIVIALDAVDGVVARKFKESALFGAIFDIMVDRVTENVLWIVLADLRCIPVWVALVFITRSLIVDSIRSHGIQQGKTPFGQIVSRSGQFLVGSRFMRGLYGTLKVVTFGWIFLLQPWPALMPGFWSQNAAYLKTATALLIYLTVAVCILRSVPVIAEFIIEQKVFSHLKFSAKRPKDGASLR
ncbi:CDP-alcohol phosphatidyltransferase family protein [candidate division TA06 bacterium]|uniref:CDP-alcohol phosphatidyltransferase family protein n=1 Tax=candidate division TA06 bacterium TaxID=2250710 RepID=A0A933I8R0_UNCT6|nr:CDP-alcohol phosphatidyltransferase family protein [candidate division TA06 bacterium]